MSESIFMPLAQRAAGRRELGGWEALWMPLGEGEAERLSGRAGGVGSSASIVPWGSDHGRIAAGRGLAASKALAIASHASLRW